MADEKYGVEYILGKIADEKPGFEYIHIISKRAAPRKPLSKQIGVEEKAENSKMFDTPNDILTKIGPAG